MAQSNEERVQVLPWPSEWNTPGGIKPGLVVIVSGAFGLVAGTLGLARVGEGALDSTIILLAGAIFAIALSAGAALLRLGVRRRSVGAVHSSRSERGSATVIPNSRGVWMATVAALSAGLLMFGFVALTSWRFVFGADDTSARMLFQASLSTAFVVAISWLFWRARRPSIGQGSLRLTPAGVVYASLSSEEYISWAALMHIFPSLGGSPDIVLGIAPSQEETTVSTKNSDIVIISGAFLSVDPALAYCALHFYLHHPQARAELGTDCSVVRIQQCAFSE